MRVCILAFAFVSSLAVCLVADEFVAGDHKFEIEFVTIGSPGNTPDTTGDPNPVGSVDYEYRIAKYEFTRGDANAVFQAGNLGTFGDQIGDYSWLAELPGDFAVSNMTWNNAARIVNWMNTSKGFSPAYNFEFQPGDANYHHNASATNWEPGDPGFNEDNPIRSSLAQYFLPSEDEWYKAAYFDPDLNDYWDYPTGSNEPPTPVVSGTDPNTAVFDRPRSDGVTLELVGPVTQAGGLSAYGVMGMGGHVSEWNEAEFFTGQTAPGSFPLARGVRGCSLGCQSPIGLSSSFQSKIEQPLRAPGFRVASVPEPACGTSLSLAMFFLLVNARHEGVCRRGVS